MTSASLNEDFLDMLEALIDNRGRFVVVGALALAVHGIPRATGDIDIFVAPDPENAQKVMKALRTFGAPVAAHGISTTDFATPGFVYQIGLPPRRIDILTEISGITFDEAWSGRVTVDVGGLDVPFIGRDAMIRNKIASGRGKDLIDAEALKKNT